MHFIHSYRNFTEFKKCKFWPRVSTPVGFIIMRLLTRVESFTKWRIASAGPSRISSAMPDYRVLFLAVGWMTWDWKGLRWHAVVDCSTLQVGLERTSDQWRRGWCGPSAISFCCRNVNDVTEHGTWWRQSHSSVLPWSKSCKQWLRPCTVFGTWPATSWV